MELYGDYKQAEIATNEGLRLYQDLADRMGIARSRSYLGWITLAQGDLERAKTFTEGLAQSPELVDSDISDRGLETLGGRYRTGKEFARGEPEDKSGKRRHSWNPIWPN